MIRLIGMDEETRYWVAFSVFPGIGPMRFRLLLDYFGSAKSAWGAPVSELKSLRLGEKLSEEFDHFRHTFHLDEYLMQLESARISVLPLTSAKYPTLLKEISDAPFLLYIKGRKPNVPIRLDRTVGVVGTRHITPYGKDVTTRLVHKLVSHGCTIVSGLAYGVDAVAHQAAIEAGGTTIAVLGCGIDIIAPASNARLYHQIISGSGAVISEMSLGFRPEPKLFVLRNRIISGMSRGVVVIEGTEHSGTLITARYATEQGRDVYAVPGPVTSETSRATAILLKNGAKLVESADDIIEDL